MYVYYGVSAIIVIFVFNCRYYMILLVQLVSLIYLPFPHNQQNATPHWHLIWLQPPMEQWWWWW